MSVLEKPVLAVRVKQEKGKTYTHLSYVTSTYKYIIRILQD